MSLTILGWWLCYVYVILLTYFGLYTHCTLLVLQIKKPMTLFFYGPSLIRFSLDNKLAAYSWPLCYTWNKNSKRILDPTWNTKIWYFTSLALSSQFWTTSIEFFSFLSILCFCWFIKSVPRLPNGTVFGYTLDRTAAAAGSLPSLVR